MVPNNYFHLSASEYNTSILLKSSLRLVIRKGVNTNPWLLCQYNLFCKDIFWDSKLSNRFFSLTIASNWWYYKLIFLISVGHCYKKHFQRRTGNNVQWSFDTTLSSCTVCCLPSCLSFFLIPEHLLSGTSVDIGLWFVFWGPSIGAIDYPNNAGESPWRWLYILYLISCKFLQLKWYISHVILTLILNKIMKQVLLFACHDLTVGHLMYCPQRETVACTTLRKTLSTLLDVRSKRSATARAGSW